LNPMIKVINLVSVLAAPVLIIIEIQNKGVLSMGVITTSVVLIAIVVAAIVYSKLGGFGKKADNAAKF
jgi:K(+)-stimulated pyrophosphate-energized sodium pump